MQRACESACTLMMLPCMIHFEADSLSSCYLRLLSMPCTVALGICLLAVHTWVTTANMKQSDAVGNFEHPAACTTACTDFQPKPSVFCTIYMGASSAWLFHHLFSPSSALCSAWHVIAAGTLEEVTCCPTLGLKRHSIVVDGHVVRSLKVT